MGPVLRPLERGGWAFGVTNPRINSFAVQLPKFESSESRMLYAMKITAIESLVGIKPKVTRAIMDRRNFACVTPDRD